MLILTDNGLKVLGQVLAQGPVNQLTVNNPTPSILQLLQYSSLPLFCTLLQYSVCKFCIKSKKNTSAARRFPMFQSRNACHDGAQYGCTDRSETQAYTLYSIQCAMNITSCVRRIISNDTDHYTTLHFFTSQLSQ